MNEKTQIFDLQPLRLDSTTPFHREDTSLIDADAYDMADIPDSEQSHNELTLSSLNQNVEPRFFQILRPRSVRENDSSPDDSLQARKTVSLQEGTDELEILNVRALSYQKSTFNRKSKHKLSVKPREAFSARADSRTLMPFEASMATIPTANLLTPTSTTNVKSQRQTLMEKLKLESLPKSPKNTTPSRRRSVFAPIVDGLKSAQSLITRAKVKSVFHQMLKKDIPLANNQYDLVDDKSAVWGESPTRKRWRFRSSEFIPRKKPRFRELLEKHAIVRPNIQTELIQKLLTTLRNRKKSRFRRCYESILRLKRRLAIMIKRIRAKVAQPIDPSGTRRTVWDLITMVFTFYEVIFGPFYLGFEFYPSAGVMRFELLKDIFFFLEIFLNFHTGYFKDGVLIVSHKKIAKRYLKTWFSVDLLANLPYGEIIAIADGGISHFIHGRIYGASLQYSRVLKLLRTFKWFKIKKVLTKYQDHIESRVMIGVLGLFSLLLYVIFLAHWLACIWHLTGLKSLEVEPESWLSVHGYQAESVPERYVTSLFWAITTMLTVGYGDITPVNIIERIVNIFGMLLGCAVFAYSMNSIGLMFRNINLERNKKRQKYYLISKYMKRRNVPKDMQITIKRYLDYLFEHQSETISEEKHALSLLSDNLQGELTKIINGKALRENALFQINFGSKFLSVMSKELEESIYSPQEIIFDETDTKFAIYFISAGSVELFYPQCRKQLKIINKDQFFGEISFFTDKPRTASAKSHTFSNIFSITKQTFLALLENFPPEKETSCQIKDSINLYENYQVINLECYSCGKEGHYARQCPNIHLAYNKEELIQQHLLEHKKFGQSFLRSDMKKFHAVKDSKYIETRATNFCDEKFDLVKGLLGMRRLRMTSQVLKKNHLKGLSRLLVKLNTKKLPLSLTAFLKENEKRLSKRTIDEMENPVPIVQRNSEPNEIDEKLEQEGEDENEEDSGDEDGHLDDGEYYKDTMNKYRYPYRSRKALVSNDMAMFSDDIDMVRNYQIYFPHNNVTKIIQSIEQQEAKKNKREKMKKEVENVRVGLNRLESLSQRHSTFTGLPSPERKALKSKLLNLPPSSEV